MDGISDDVALSCLQEEALLDCNACLAKLCLREKLINLALGRTKIMYCLYCLAKQENTPPERLLAKIKSYILSRKCFQKEWIKYMSHSLDLRGIACPLNFVKTRLYLDTLIEGEVLQVLLDSGEPVNSVYASVLEEGHTVSPPEARNDGSYLLTIRKQAPAVEH
jgi:TusA-related sulfurtransferase